LISIFTITLDHDWSVDPVATVNFLEISIPKAPAYSLLAKFFVRILVDVAALEVIDENSLSNTAYPVASLTSAITGVFASL
jgi:hypothetical protein